MYESPKSNLEKSAIPQKGSPIKAVVVGILIDYIGTIFAVGMIGIIFGVYWGLQNFSDAELEYSMNNNPTLLALCLIASCIFSAVGGYFTAKIANHNEYKLGVILTVVSLILGELILLFMPESKANLPTWYLWTSYLLSPVTLFGVYLRVQETKKPS